jgi:hypothetical protein
VTKNGINIKIIKTASDESFIDDPYPGRALRIEKLLLAPKRDPSDGQMWGTKNQIRRASKPGGPEKEAEISAEEGAKGLAKGLRKKVRIEKCSAMPSGTGVTAALKSASGECSPLQQICSDLGESGADGADS